MVHRELSETLLEASLMGSALVLWVSDSPVLSAAKLSCGITLNNSLWQRVYGIYTDHGGSEFLRRSFHLLVYASNR